MPNPFQIRLHPSAEKNHPKAVMFKSGYPMGFVHNRRMHLLHMELEQMFVGQYEYLVPSASKDRQWLVDRQPIGDFFNCPVVAGHEWLDFLGFRQQNSSTSIQLIIPEPTTTTDRSSKVLNKDDNLPFVTWLLLLLLIVCGCNCLSAQISSTNNYKQQWN